MNNEIERLSQKITAARYEKMRRALANRTRKLTVVIEDVYQPHNASAVLRNCDAFGVQDVWFIENKYLWRGSGSVDMGASKWLTIRRRTCPEAVVPKNGISQKHIVSPAAAENTRRTLDEIRARGYAIAASTLRAGAGTLDDIPADRPLALLVGTELTGLSEAAHEKSDYFFSMPMLGFAQSFNMSVFTALCLENFSRRIRAKGGWELTPDERESLLLQWLKISAGE